MEARGLAGWFPVGNVLLIILAVMVYFGLMHGVLDRMRLRDRTALLAILGIIVGAYFSVTIARGRNELVVNIGGAVVPAIVAIYLLVTADERVERIRGTLAAVITGVTVYVVGRIIPGGEPGLGVIDPLYVHALVAGAVGYLSGRSRRSAFIGGSLGMILADVGHYIDASIRQVPSRTVLGGGGAFDATIVAAVLAVALAEVIGETREYLSGGPGRPHHRGGDRDAEPVREHADVGERHENSGGDDHENGR
jgi:uncharacterized membrane protein